MNRLTGRLKNWLANYAMHIPRLIWILLVVASLGAGCASDQRSQLRHVEWLQQPRRIDLHQMGLEGNINGMDFSSDGQLLLVRTSRRVGAGDSTVPVYTVFSVETLHHMFDPGLEIPSAVASRFENDLGQGAKAGHPLIVRSVKPGRPELTLNISENFKQDSESFKRDSVLVKCFEGDAGILKWETPVRTYHFSGALAGTFGSNREEKAVLALPGNKTFIFDLHSGHLARVVNYGSTSDPHTPGADKPFSAFSIALNVNDGLVACGASSSRLVRVFDLVTSRQLMELNIAPEMGTLSGGCCWMALEVRFPAPHFLTAGAVFSSRRTDHYFNSWEVFDLNTGRSILGYTTESLDLSGPAMSSDGEIIAIPLPHAIEIGRVRDVKP
jgi:WD40 repeat protein